MITSPTEADSFLGVDLLERQQQQEAIKRL
jgi:hypothetical protein